MASGSPLPNIEPTIGTFFVAAISSVGVGITFTTFLLTVGSSRPLHFQSGMKFLPFNIATKSQGYMICRTLEFVKTTLAVNGCYFVTVKNWGNNDVLGQPTWDMKVVLVFTTCIIIITHLFFIHKIWVLLNRKIIFPLLLTIVAFASFVLGISAYALTVFTHSYNDFNLADRLTMAALACALAVDWAVTISLVILLRGHRSDFGRTNKIIKRLIFYSINVGLLTSLTDLVVLVLLQIDFVPFGLYAISLYEIVGNLYANSLLACLNSRSSISKDFEGSDSVEKLPQITIRMETIRFRSGTSGDDDDGALMDATFNGPLGEPPQRSETISVSLGQADGKRSSLTSNIDNKSMSKLRI